MVEDVSIRLDTGETITTVGNHLWVDAGLPGLSRCECGIYRRYDGMSQNYLYSEKEN